MVKYEYDPIAEGFRRTDNRGRILEINIAEARRIETLMNLGWSVDSIYEKIHFNGNVTRTTCRSFIRNLKEGNITLEGDFPAPKELMENLDLEARVSKLESEIELLKQQHSNCECEESGFKGKVKSWIS